MFKLDPKHESFDPFDDKFVQDINRLRYFQEGETSIVQMHTRVVSTVYANDPFGEHKAEAYDVLRKALFMPAGRILRGEGTMMNCFVSGTIEDSIPGIFKRLGEAMTTLSKFGGIGQDFSTIRPKGAKVSRGLVSPGVLAWMDLWHEAAEQIQQAGHRRGAMMGTLDIHHPDVLDFIKAKQTPGRLTNFNVSLLVTDQFMKAVKADDMWVFYNEHPPLEVQSHSPILNTFKVDGKVYYAYSSMPARELWDIIMRNTYEYAEPGVIFIDRVNEMNNLGYLETIRATNPCGEQPLPPYGCCLLGHINLARLVTKPFTDKAGVDWVNLRKVVKVAVRFLDNVIDVTEYPLPEQKQEEIDKRRIGLGYAGLADMLAQLGMPYGSKEALIFIDAVTRDIASEAYNASIELAKERGPFPFYNAEEFWDSTGWAARNMKPDLLGRRPIRNGVLLTVAPCGTVAIAFGNVAGGLEPTYAHKQRRKVWTSNVPEDFDSESFTSRFFKHCIDSAPWQELPKYCNTMEQVLPREQLEVQAHCQWNCDASISKTINLPEGTTFEDFKEVYQIAFDTGCKGCTTYRPSGVRGQVLMSLDAPLEPDVPVEIPQANREEISEPSKSSVEFTKQAKRPAVLLGITHKITWPNREAAIFLTVNENDGRPWEIFIASKDLGDVQWTVLACVQASWELQHGRDLHDIADQMMQIRSTNEGAWIGKKYFNSLVAYIGYLLKEHADRIGTSDRPLSGGSQELPDMMFTGDDGKTMVADFKVTPRNACPKCAGVLYMAEGCKKCTQCDYSSCG